MVSLGLTRSSTHRAAEPTSHGMHPPKKKIRLPCKWGNIHHRFEPFRVPAFINFCFFWARMLNSSKLSKFYRHIHMANDFEVIIDPENRNRRFLRSYRTSESSTQSTSESDRKGFFSRALGMIHKLRPGTRWAMASSLSFFFLVGGLEHALFSIYSEIILPIDFHMFQDG